MEVVKLNGAPAASVTGIDCDAVTTSLGYVVDSVILGRLARGHDTT